jgi:hypothetical protein
MPNDIIGNVHGFYFVLILSAQLHDVDTLQNVNADNHQEHDCYKKQKSLAYRLEDIIR